MRSNIGVSGCQKAYTKKMQQDDRKRGDLDLDVRDVFLQGEDNILVAAPMRMMREGSALSSLCDRVYEHLTWITSLSHLIGTSVLQGTLGSSPLTFKAQPLGYHCYYHPVQDSSKWSSEGGSSCDWLMPSEKGWLRTVTSLLGESYSSGKNMPDLY